MTNSDQAWFWSEDWQAAEREAEEDIKAGRVSGPFSSVEEVKARLTLLRNQG